MRSAIAVGVAAVVLLWAGVAAGRYAERAAWSKQFAGYQAERIAREGKRDKDLSPW